MSPTPSLRAGSSLSHRSPLSGLARALCLTSSAPPRLDGEEHIWQVPACIGVRISRNARPPMMPCTVAEPPGSRDN
jgi:hypothetical protein